jgi:phosphoglucosamine mutase
VDRLFSKLGIKYDIINNTPNGCNINDNCGSLYIDNLGEYVRSNNLDGGVAFDGDADRAIFVDELGNVIDGDYILAILGLNFKNNNRLNNNTIVGTVMSNLGFVKFCEENDINFIATKVGDRYVLEEMNLNNFSLGGEQSGHIIIKEYANTGDGELTAICVFDVLSKSGKKFSELSNIMKKYPQVLENVRVDITKKNEFYTNEKINNCIQEVSDKIKDSGRVLVRPSGTEPLIRVMIEGEDIEYIDSLAKYIAGVIEKELK